MRYAPIWTRNHVDDEILVFVDDGNEVTAGLAFDGAENLRIVDRDGNVLPQTEYGVCDGRVFVNKSAAFSFKADWLKNQGVPETIPSENSLYDIKNCLLLKPEFLRTKQYVASYDHKPTPFPNVFSDYIRLPKTRERLLNDKKLKIALFGDSISNAANSSYEMGIEGYGHWLDEAIVNVQDFYNAAVTYDNISRSGYGTEWAITVADEKFSALKADLVIIAFGMNDGTANMTAQTFLDNVKTLIGYAKKANPDTEFILIATPVPNSQSAQLYKAQREYFSKLTELEGDGVTVLNMTAVTDFLARRKRYIEYSGNNLNHPNDFFYRFYTDAISELFLRLKEQGNRLQWTGYTDCPKFEETHFTALPSEIKAGYLSSTINGKNNEVFCFIGAPKDDGSKRPAVVLVHGAGGNAFYKWAQSWVSRGYVAISLDTNCTHFTDDDLTERKPNPYVDELHIGGFDHVGKNPYSSWIYGSVAQVISANSYLRSLPNVDSEKIGLVGISWGGVICLNALGADARFNAGVIIYSSGFITEDLLGEETGLFTDYENKRFYETYFDPRAYVCGVKTPTLMTAGLDDGAFSPFSRERTARLFENPPKMAVIPSLLHDNESNFANANAFSFMDEAFTGKKNRVNLKLVRKGNDVIVTADGRTDGVTLCVTDGEGNPRKLKWREIPFTERDGAFFAALPDGAKYYIAYARFGDGLFTSTNLYKIN